MYASDGACIRLGGERRWDCAEHLTQQCCRRHRSVTYLLHAVVQVAPCGRSSHHIAAAGKYEGENAADRTAWGEQQVDSAGACTSLLRGMDCRVALCLARGRTARSNATHRELPLQPLPVQTVRRDAAVTTKQRRFCALTLLHPTPCRGKPGRARSRRSTLRLRMHPPSYSPPPTRRGAATARSRTSQQRRV